MCSLLINPRYVGLTFSNFTFDPTLVLKDDGSSPITYFDEDLIEMCPGPHDGDDLYTGPCSYNSAGDVDGVATVVGVWDDCGGHNMGPLCAVCNATEPADAADDWTGRSQQDELYTCASCPPMGAALAKSAGIAVGLALVIFFAWRLRGKAVRLILKYRKYNRMIADSWGAGGFIAGSDNTTGTLSGGMLQNKLLADIVKQARFRSMPTWWRPTV